MSAYTALRSRAKDLGEHNDCSVLALAHVLKVSYDTARLALVDAGRKANDGTSPLAMRKALEALGFYVKRDLTPSALQLLTGCRAKPTTYSPYQHPDKWADMPDLLLFVPGHVAAFVDGEVEDWTRDRSAPIEYAWEVARANQTITLGQEPPPIIYLGAPR